MHQHAECGDGEERATQEAMEEKAVQAEHDEHGGDPDGVRAGPHHDGQQADTRRTSGAGRGGARWPRESLRPARLLCCAHSPPPWLHRSLASTTGHRPDPVASRQRGPVVGGEGHVLPRLSRVPTGSSPTYGRLSSRPGHLSRWPDVRAVLPLARRAGRAAVGSSPRLSDSQMVAESPAGLAAPAAAASAPRWPAGESYRLDMTGSCSARQITSRPAAMKSTAPAKATPRHGMAVSVAWPVSPDTGATAVLGAAPPVTEPGRLPAPAPVAGPALLAAALSMSAAEILAATATAIPIPNAASRMPATRRSLPRRTTRGVASTAASPASAATASGLAAGTRFCPLTVTTPAGSGFGAAADTCAQPCRIASSTSPTPAAATSRTIKSSRRPGRLLVTAISFRLHLAARTPHALAHAARLSSRCPPSASAHSRTGALISKNRQNAVIGPSRHPRAFSPRALRPFPAPGR